MPCLRSGTEITFSLFLRLVSVYACIVYAHASESVASSTFSLSSDCPPSFEKMHDATCELRSLYEFYNSPEGFGGLMTPLPKHQGGYTPEQIDLGRYLFFDPVLSKEKNLSCASCHHPDLGFSDGLAQSIGTAKKVTRRSSPSLWNSGFLNSLFWDGRANDLQEQAKGPLFAEDELANTPENLEKTLNDNDNYRSLFAEAFKLERDTPISVELVAQALAAFQSSLISLNSRYDRYAHGDEDVLNEQEILGHNVFRSFVTRCSQCHTPPLFTNQQLAVTGAPDLVGNEFDAGAQPVLQLTQMRGAFKVPTLRNIALTSPYMHSGAISDLPGVISFYNDERGHAVPETESLLLHWHIVNPRLTQVEEAALVAFLNTLTDEVNKPDIPIRVPSGLAVSLNIKTLE